MLCFDVSGCYYLDSIYAIVYHETFLPTYCAICLDTEHSTTVWKEQKVSSEAT